MVIKVITVIYLPYSAIVKRATSERMAVDTSPAPLFPLFRALGGGLYYLQASFE
jgi:hypothetical protein